MSGAGPAYAHPSLRLALYQSRILHEAQCCAWCGLLLSHLAPWNGSPKASGVTTFARQLQRTQRPLARSTQRWWSARSRCCLLTKPSWVSSTVQTSQRRPGSTTLQVYYYYHHHHHHHHHLLSTQSIVISKLAVCKSRHFPPAMKPKIHYRHPRTCTALFWSSSNHDVP